MRCCHRDRCHCKALSHRARWYRFWLPKEGEEGKTSYTSTHTFMYLYMNTHTHIHRCICTCMAHMPSDIRDVHMYLYIPNTHTHMYCTVPLSPLKKIVIMAWCLNMHTCCTCISVLSNTCTYVSCWTNYSFIILFPKC